MNTVEYLSDAALNSVSGGLAFSFPTSSKSGGNQIGSRNIQIVQSGVATNHGTVVQNAYIYTAPVTINNVKNTTFVF